jgi:hypothetical protein
MQEKPQSIDVVLPFGENLRVLMEQTFISKSDLKNLLRKRGVFSGSHEKQDTIPLLMNCLLSPIEFDFLKEGWTTKEDNPKVSTQSIQWETDKKLMESLPESIQLNNIIAEEFINYSVVGAPYFVVVPDHADAVRMDFEIERKDLTKSWITNKCKFKGSVSIQNDGTNKIHITVIHTAPETKNVGQKLTRHLTNHFKQTGSIGKSAEFERVLFSAFDNSERVNFFWDMTRNQSSGVIEFLDVVDIEFCPDTTTSLPEKINWMESHIEELKLNGKSLHETFFIKDADYHPFIELYRVDARFRFDVTGAAGFCVLSYEFPGYAKAKDIKSEMEINVVSITPEKGYKNFNRNSLKKKLLASADKIKTNSFLSNKKKNA